MIDAPIVVAMTGASGAAYGKRLVEVLLAAGREVHFTFSGAAAQVIQAELNLAVSQSSFDARTLFDAPMERLRYWHESNLNAGIASGSFATAGMVVVPCSMSTLAAVATGNCANLIHRAADVHLKERRKLILTPRETPLSLVALRNMTTVTEAGAVVLPAMPGFYHQPRSIEQLVDFVVARICSQLSIDLNLVCPWGK